MHAYSANETLAIDTKISDLNSDLDYDCLTENSQFNFVGGIGVSQTHYVLSGIGLMEIVTEPDFTNGTEAAAFVSELKLVLESLGTCSGKMAGNTGLAKMPVWHSCMIKLNLNRL